ncbi:MAG: hypothetical protein L6R45_23850 [Anaerolineae bacterium]|nr:hypothetical protein [Anaerolineae bacterium]
MLDTHTIIWLTHGDARLSLTPRQVIDAVTEQASQVAISSISLVETAYLEERDRIPAGTLVRVIAATALSLSVPLVSRDRKIQDSQIQTIW